MRIRGYLDRLPNGVQDQSYNMQQLVIEIRRTKGIGDLLSSVLAGGGNRGDTAQKVLAAIEADRNDAGSRVEGIKDRFRRSLNSPFAKHRDFERTLAAFLRQHDQLESDHPELFKQMVSARVQARRSAVDAAATDNADAASNVSDVRTTRTGVVAAGAKDTNPGVLANPDLPTMRSNNTDPQVLAEVEAEVESSLRDSLNDAEDGVAEEWVRYDPNTKELEFSADNLPNGLVIDRFTAEISGTSRTSTSAGHNILVLAREMSSGGRVEGEYIVGGGPIYLEIQDCADASAEGMVPGFTPSCTDKGRCIDTAPFDDDYYCVCDEGVTGDRCELSNSGDNKKSDQVALGVTIGVVIFMIIAGTTVIFAWRYNVRKERQRPIDFMNYWSDFKSKGVLAVDVERKTPKEIPRRLVTMHETIGSGAFGEVSKGILNEQNSKGLIGIMVAIKRAKLDMEAGEFEQQRAFIDLIQEAALMAQFDHPNILGLIGVCTKGISDGDPLLLIVQYCENGNLCDFLSPKTRQGIAMPSHARLRICKEVALGMSYLAAKSFIHRDLAARNVLVDTEFVCKVSDFGLSRDIGVNDDDPNGKTYYRTTGEGALPVRWTAIEALEESKFTTASDVWSFGILCAEVFQDCQTPYYGMKNHDVWLQLRAGYRHEQPKECPNRVYRKILQPCWLENPTKRPTFPSLVELLEELQVGPLRVRFIRWCVRLWLCLQ